MLKTAVVILNWNGKELLGQFLPSVIEHSKEAEIYVIDNASADSSIAFLRVHFPKVKIVLNQDNYGFAKGYNKGLDQIDAEVLVLLNSDVEVSSGWLNPIVHQLEKELNTAIIQPKILSFHNKAYFEYAGAAGGFIDRFGFPFCRGRIFDTLEKDQQQYNDITDVFWASGACFAIRKKVFNELGGFDNDFFAHQEEIDLCWRAQNRGYQIKYNGLSTVYHVGGATLSYQNPKKTALNFRNNLYLLFKNLPTKQLFPILFCRLSLDGMAAIQFLFKGQFKNIGAIFIAHFFFYLHIPSLIKKRKSTQKPNYYYTHSIAYQYFVKKNKFFHLIPKS